MSDVAGVGPALSALIEQWRASADHLTSSMPLPSTSQDIYRLRHCADELEAALSGSVGGLNAAPPWQEIATAPKYQAVLVFYESYGEQLTARRGERGWSVAGLSEHYNIQTPTHWMPLPASPVCAAEKKA